MQTRHDFQVGREKILKTPSLNHGGVFVLSYFAFYVSFFGLALLIVVFFT